MHVGYEEIWSGERLPDRKDDERHVFTFEDFAFHLRPGAYGPHAGTS
jgi:hypothetical protein